VGRRTPGDGVEKILARIETETASIIKRLRNFSLTGDDRGILALFVAFTLVRVRAFRVCVEDLGAGVATALLRMIRDRVRYAHEQVFASSEAAASTLPP
jgi:hypothetical protein